MTPNVSTKEADGTCTIILGEITEKGQLFLYAIGDQLISY